MKLSLYSGPTQQVQNNSKIALTMSRPFFYEEQPSDRRTLVPLQAPIRQFNSPKYIPQSGTIRHPRLDEKNNSKLRNDRTKFLCFVEQTGVLDRALSSKPPQYPRENRAF